ncbi:MAG TPA: phosphotransferase, partial [Anaerolineae bacterium]|nr:phosphotransferase [Anaerolineae bacterium]
IHSLQQDHTALRDKLEKMPQTLVHGDFKLGNLGLMRGNSTSLRTIVLDWQDATRGAGVLDLGYFLALNARWLPFPKETAIQIYTNVLESRGCSFSIHDVKLGCLAGGALRLLWLMVNNAQPDLDWWYDLIRRAAASL